MNAERENTVTIVLLFVITIAVTILILAFVPHASAGDNDIWTEVVSEGWDDGTPGIKTVPGEGVRWNWDYYKQDPTWSDPSREWDEQVFYGGTGCPDLYVLLSHVSDEHSGVTRYTNVSYSGDNARMTAWIRYWDNSAYVRTSLMRIGHTSYTDNDVWGGMDILPTVQQEWQLWRVTFFVDNDRRWGKSEKYDDENGWVISEENDLGDSAVSVGYLYFDAGGTGHAGAAMTWWDDVTIETLLYESPPSLTPSVAAEENKTVSLLLFLTGLIMFGTGPFLGVWSYHEGVDGPMAFVGAMLCTCIGIGLITGVVLV
jgi:hypothetical protein